ncbi:ead/Ea22-like family protein [Enterobacter asburiae]|uniref:ead/Ea22-like family protein n=1 Tax=Enterobacter asburiae TaxID=61645 RepID=UPI0034CD8266
MSNIDKQTLRRAAMWIGDEKWVHAGKGEVISEEYVANGETLVDHICNCEVVGTSSLRAEFIAAANPATVLALLDELEAAETRIAELSTLQGKPIAWESTTPVYIKFITDERYQRLRPGYKKWYKPYRCSQCAAACKGEAS